ncbi:MAG: 3'-5' exonuclease [Myxococcales bacterium]|jgi:DNA polymerase-3 subunit epsilon|nr:3'-5' exonuclease [Myxococcales bacterium]
MKGAMDGGGCFRTGRHYPGIAHLIKIVVQGLAQEWSGEDLMTDIPFVSIDTETTGRDSAVDRIIELGCVIFRGGEVVARKGWLIDPGCPIPADATEVHGIRDEDVAGKPTFAEVLPEYLEFVAGCLPLAYNAAFDRDFLQAEIGRVAGAAGIPGPLPPAARSDVAWLDPLHWARELQKEERSRALADVCARLGITLERAHRATDDAEAAGRVMLAFLNDVRVPRTYAAFLKEQRRLDTMFGLERLRWRNN